jgi:hypothetical protein
MLTADTTTGTVDDPKRHPYPVFTGETVPWDRSAHTERLERLWETPRRSATQPVREQELRSVQPGAFVGRHYVCGSPICLLGLVACCCPERRLQCRYWAAGGVRVGSATARGIDSASERRNTGIPSEAPCAGCQPARPERLSPPGGVSD